MMEILKAENRYHHALCVYVRTIVFTLGQDVPVDLEIEPNEDEAVDFLGLVDGKPVATARYRMIDECAKIERVATLKEARGKGCGLVLMKTVIEDINDHYPGCEIKLSSQDQAIPFYEKAGFTVEGEGFMDAGIPHHMMRLKEQKNHDRDI